MKMTNGRIDRAHTIIFTEACPLDCRYCDPKNDECYKQSGNFSEEELNSKIAIYDKQDDENTYNSIIIFSGGEPFLYWKWIKKIILKYKNRFTYSFNTSGYLLTPEIIEFLSDYRVNFLLSVDGNEALTNYLRPVKSTPYHTGYYKKLKQILPTLLYYFPNIPYKIIINARYVDLLYQMYQDAAALGFKYFSFIIDFAHRRSNNKDFQMWYPKHTEILKEQLDLIIQDQLLGFTQDIKKPEIIQINQVLKFLFKEDKSFSTDKLICELFNARTVITTHQNENINNNCFSSYFNSFDEIEKTINQQYKETNHQCPKDKDCPAFDYCALHNCLQRGFMQNKNCFDFDDLECYVSRSVYEAAIKFLSIGNDLLQDNKLYNTFILKQIEGEF